MLQLPLKLPLILLSACGVESVEWPRRGLRVKGRVVDCFHGPVLFLLRIESPAWLRRLLLTQLGRISVLVLLVLNYTVLEGGVDSNVSDEFGVAPFSMRSTFRGENIDTNYRCLAVVAEIGL